MGRVIAIALIVAWSGVADAETKRKVRIESTPPGAVVYLVEKEAGPACEPTPCTVRVGIGETLAIIELKDHEPRFQNIVVPKRGKVPTVSVTLDPAIGTIVVDGPAGAMITVDEVEEGEAPLRIDTTADVHHVVVTLNGKTIYDQFVDVTLGVETAITPTQVATGGGDDGELPDDGEPAGSGGEVTTKAPKGPRGSYLRVTAAVDVGFRAFRYQNIGTPQTLRQEDEAGQVLAGPIIEVWPGTLAGIHLLRGLSLLGRFQFGVNKQPVTGAGLTGMATTTFWQSAEVSVRHRWVVRDMLTLEPGVGYVRDQFQFSGMAQNIDLLPDVDYQSIRIGVRASLLLGKFEPYVIAENRIVTSGGKLAARFGPASSASGLRGAIGVTAQLDKLTFRVDASTTRYSWDFTSDDPVYVATGGMDAIIQLGFGIGYEY